jgi:aminoglycoside phosphotransferase (APT) family kinase protein
MTSSEAVAAYVCSVVAECQPERVVGTTRFTGGENHAVHRVSYLDGTDIERDVVVRVANSASDASRDRAAREAAVLVALGGRSSPRLHAFQSRGPLGGAPVMCMEHVHGRFEPLETASVEQLAQLGRAVRSVHRVPAEELAGVLRSAPDLPGYVADRLQSMLDRMSLVRDPLPASLQAQFTVAATWAQETADRLCGVDQPPALCLLHGDVSAGNVLWAPHPVLIDWEYARIGDPADEIGYLFGQNALSTDQREGFWRGYHEGLRDGDRIQVVERASVWEPLTLFGSALYWIDLWSRRVQADAGGRVDDGAPKEAGYYLAFATQYLDRCEEIRGRSAASPSLGASADPPAGG